MKRVILFVIFLFLITTRLALAQEKMATDGASLSPTPTPFVYQLPYPVLLPDSPLYFLKTFRDRLIDFLVSDPLKKAELNLLQSDKRLAGGIALFAKDKQTLAESTISKGENYFSDAIAKTTEAKKAGMATKDIVQKLTLSVQKHEAVLKDLEQKAPKEIKPRFTLLIQRVDDFEKQVEALSKK